MHWMRPVRHGAPIGSTRPDEPSSSIRPCSVTARSRHAVLRRPSRGLVITQIRKTAGPKFGEWSLKFFQAIADGLVARSGGR